MERHEFDAAYARICEVCGVKTQTELSAYLGIRQSSISDAGRRNAVPAAWLLTILSRERVNPAWTLTGEGPRYLVPSSLPPSAAFHRIGGETVSDSFVKVRFLDVVIVNWMKKIRLFVLIRCA